MKTAFTEINNGYGDDLVGLSLSVEEGRDRIGAASMDLANFIERN